MFVERNNTLEDNLTHEGKEKLIIYENPTQNFCYLPNQRTFFFERVCLVVKNIATGQSGEKIFLFPRF